MIRFMKLRWLYFFISAVVILPGLFSLVRFGLKPSIDFTGGTLLQVELLENNASSVEFGRAKGVLSGTMELASVQNSGEKGLILKGEAIDAEKKQRVLQILQENYGKLRELRFESVGPLLGRELITKMLIAIGISAGFITVYVAYRFRELRYGVCAVIAMFHDSFVLLGAFSLLGHFFGVEVDALFVTAVLTILSFSVHDTIVVYDRIRELRRKMPKVQYVELVNTAVTETIVRSLNNSLTIIVMLLALWLMGGETIRWFVFALLVGTITGTYSSTFTAAPLLVVWEDLKHRRKQWSVTKLK